MNPQEHWKRLNELFALQEELRLLKLRSPQDPRLTELRKRRSELYHELSHGLKPETASVLRNLGLTEKKGTES